MSDPRRRRSVSETVLVELLSRQLADWQQRNDLERAHVVDLGGGTGTLAAVLADLGHTITVIDPSPDALASLQRRTEELTRQSRPGADPQIRGLQGDASEIVQLVGADSTDVVVCHRVLEVVDRPDEALASMAQALRPGGALSLLISQRRSAVLNQALSGHLAAARRTWQDPSRVDLEQVLAWVQQAGFRVVDSDGIGAIAGHVSEQLVQSRPDGYAELLALEAEVGRDPAFRAIAPLVHVFAELPAR